MQSNVRNETKKLIQKFNSVAVIKITDIRLRNQIIKPPGTKVFFRVLYCNKEYLNRIRNPDLNFSIFEIKLNESLEMLIQVFIKGLLVKENEKEIGTCWVEAQDFDDRIVKRQVLHNGDLVGHIDLALKIFSENPNVSTQSTCNSLDMKEEFLKETRHIDKDFFKQMNLSNHSNPSQDQISDLSFEQKSPQSIFDYIQKVSAKKTKFHSEQKSLEALCQVLQSRCLNLALQKSLLQAESCTLQQEKQKIQSTISILNLEFSSLKHEQFKNRAHKNLIIQSKSQMARQLNHLTLQRQIKPQTNSIYSLNQIQSQSQRLLVHNKENLIPRPFSLSKLVHPINSCESPVPEDLS